MFLRAKPDRRGFDRLRVPECPNCPDVDVTVSARTDDLVFFRCCGCETSWSTAKPTSNAPDREADASVPQPILASR